MITPDDFRFFLDSGAYSAWSRGAEIDLDEYIEFIKANIERIDVYANLDCLAGKPGEHSTPAMKEEGAARSWENFLYMVNQGLSPLPVYHIGEDRKWLDKMLDFGCDYVGLGGLVGVPSAQRREWLDGVFDYICDERGYPKIKTHGFGMTSIPLIFRYPWYSVDSTSWIKTTASGAVYLPVHDGREFRFDQTPLVASVSSTSPRLVDSGHSANWGPAMRDRLMEWLSICGQSYDQVSANYYHRAVVNVTFFKRVSEAKQDHPFQRDLPRRGSLW